MSRICSKPENSLKRAAEFLQIFWTCPAASLCVARRMKCSTCPKWKSPFFIPEFRRRRQWRLPLRRENKTKNASFAKRQTRRTRKEIKRIHLPTQRVRMHNSSRRIVNSARRSALFPFDFTRLHPKIQSRPRWQINFFIIINAYIYIYSFFYGNYPIAAAMDFRKRSDWVPINIANDRA